ncbi:hypothetical protein C8J57DRAFT_1613791 [Mycena rebaudengoi]|nr:hypothetical protein C8J57DRAFT_1613791 [Mycena rebaudengoi]
MVWRICAKPAAGAGHTATGSPIASISRNYRTCLVPYYFHFSASPSLSMASLTPLEDPAHHVGGLLVSSSPRIPPAKRRIQDKPYTPDPADISVLVRWAVCPTAALQLLAVPPLLALLVHLLLLYLPPSCSTWRNPFTPFFHFSCALPSAPLRTSSTTLRPALIPTTPSLFH